MFKIIYLFFVIIACGCAPLDEENLEDNQKTLLNVNQLKNLDKKQQKMLAGMRSIIDEIRFFDADELDENFYNIPLNYKNDKRTTIHFFGEIHDRSTGQIENLGAINTIAKNGGIILLEGSDWGYTLRQKGECGILLIYEIYIKYQWEKKGSPYDPDIQYSWIKKQDFPSMYHKIKSYLDISDLNISKLRCGTWDNEVELKKPIDDKTVIKRNETLVDRLGYHITNYSAKEDGAIIIMSGYRHNPFGDFYDALKSIDIGDFISTFGTPGFKKEQVQQESLVILDRFYDFVDNKPAKIKDKITGTSRVIYEFLQKSSFFAIEHLHKSFLNS